MSPFFLSHQVSYTRRIAAPQPAVLAFLHDPPAVMGLSPLIIDVSVNPDDKTKYTIQDELVLPFGYRTKMSYRATITLHDDGMLAETAAGAGTRTVLRYTVRAISEEETEIEEVTNVNALFLFMPFIKSTLRKAHKETLDRLAARLEDKPVPGG
ncbi:hypothetical protein K438DRAFT_1558071 [Mycena galopus ATCC 62051]|nr:hypothetical protein K438DRAFT_1558071 [Mycena galopus ATCC 62051]